MAAAPNTLTNYYTWGLDLSGSLQGAGGVGGLLAITSVTPGGARPAIFFPCYDANGNVTGYLDTNGVSVAAVMYDAFGRKVSGTADAGLRLPYGFSTKYLDEETGLYYYGYRFYHPELGLWVSRDPIGERGGINLYGFVANNSINAVDVSGLRVYVGTEGNWTYSATYNVEPYSSKEIGFPGQLEVLVSYKLDAAQRKCCKAVRVDRYVRIFLLGGDTIGPYILDHATKGGYWKEDGQAEDDGPDGPAPFPPKVYRWPWTQSFKWIAVCTRGANANKTISVLKKNFHTTGHWSNQPYSGSFEWGV